MAAQAPAAMASSQIGMKIAFYKSLAIKVNAFKLKAANGVNITIHVQEGCFRNGRCGAFLFGGFFRG